MTRLRSACSVSPTGAAPPDLRGGAEERMAGADLVVAVGAEEEQVLDLGVGDELDEELERSGVEPLQIVDEERERMLAAREHADEAKHGALEPLARVLRRQLDDVGLRPDDELEL